ncbi:hypothetical protein, partial [Pseudoalteromonas distincta]|uniref:hypothetical protein n=1 Tax=Pseudoalteromonas distincta TaxID=77608 RepID=UPI0034E8BD45
IPEQVVTGRKVKSLGLGFMIRPEELTPKVLRERVFEVIEDTLLRRRLAEMRNTVGGYGGSMLAAQLLNEAAASR